MSATPSSHARSRDLLIPVALSPSGRLVKSWEGEPKHRYRCPDARIRAELSSESVELKAAKLADIHTLTKTYKQIWDATEAQRRIGISLARRVYRYQRELIAKETTETHAIWMGKSTGEHVEAAPAGVGQ